MDLTRRGFLKSAGVAAGAAAILPATTLPCMVGETQYGVVVAKQASMLRPGAVVNLQQQHGATLMPGTGEFEVETGSRSSPASKEEFFALARMAKTSIGRVYISHFRGITGIIAHTEITAVDRMLVEAAALAEIKAGSHATVLWSRPFYSPRDLDPGDKLGITYTLTFHA